MSRGSASSPPCGGEKNLDREANVGWVAVVLTMWLTQKLSGRATFCRKRGDRRRWVELGKRYKNTHGLSWYGTQAGWVNAAWLALHGHRTMDDEGPTIVRGLQVVNSPITISLHHSASQTGE